MTIKPSTTIISNNCFGSRISQDLGFQYNSPTVGLAFSAKDYELFISNLEKCICQPLHFKDESKYKYRKGVKYPIGVIYVDGNEIEIWFIHYKSKEEAFEKWNRRCKRINFQDIIVLQTEDSIKDNADYNVISNLDYTRKVAFFTLRKSTQEDVSDDTYCYVKELVSCGSIAAYQEAHTLYKYLAKVNWMN